MRFGEISTGADMSLTPNSMLNNVTGNSTVTIPAGYSILQIIFENTTGNPIIGGLKIGTTDGGTDVVAAYAVGANSLNRVADVSILKAGFSKTVDTALYIQAVTLWNSASINLHFVLRKFN